MNTQTTKKTNHYFRVLVALAMLASMLVVLSARTYARLDYLHRQPDIRCIGREPRRWRVRHKFVRFGRPMHLEGRYRAGQRYFWSGHHQLQPLRERTLHDHAHRAVAHHSRSADHKRLHPAWGFSQYPSQGNQRNLLIELNGTEAGTADGLEIGAGGSGSLIKGLVINRFSNQGIDVSSLSAALTNVRIEGNFVGTDPSGTQALPNSGDGIEMDASNSVVGGSTVVKRNLISGNDVDGLSLSGANDVRVENNLVGTKADGVGALGNLFNGVDLSGTTGVSILRNSIFSNGQLGIDLGVDGRTLNDLGDADSGANALQNFPVLTSAKTGGGKSTVKGKLNSRPNSGYQIQFFSNPSGNDEGKKFIGEKSITTDGSGNASFTFTPSSKVGVGQAITATATKDTTGNTSEFSDARKVASS